MTNRKKGKKEKMETIDELIEEMNDAENLISQEVKNIPDPPKKVDITTPDEGKRDELVKLAEDGKLDKSVAYVKKASDKAIDKLYTEYERKRVQEANEFITDLAISKFCDLLGGFDAIENSEELMKELRKNELLKRDVCSLIEKVTPYVPLIGILSGGLTTSKHIYNHRYTTTSETIPEVIPEEKP